MSEAKIMQAAMAGTIAVSRECGALSAANDGLHMGFTASLNRLHSMSLGMTLGVPSAEHHAGVIRADNDVSGLPKTATIPGVQVAESPARSTPTRQGSSSHLKM